MTQSEIIEMARQAGFWKDLFAYAEFKEHLEAFAKLVAKKAYLEGVNSGISAEREACAKICDDDGKWQAIAIRARGEA